MKQPDALQLADELDRAADRITRYTSSTGDGLLIEAAAELRRLHEVNQELVTALEFMVVGADAMGWSTREARAALAKAGGQA